MHKQLNLEVILDENLIDLVMIEKEEELIQLDYQILNA
jgi:hypothetical protein